MTSKKLSKSSTKTGGKKPVKTIQSLLDIEPKKILNKKNAIEFANYIYDEKNDGKQVYCSYIQMCTGSLKENGKKKLSCALGEAYIWFSGRDLYLKEIKREVNRHNKEVDKKAEKGIYDNNSYWDEESFISHFLAKNSEYKNTSLLSNKIYGMQFVNDCNDENYSERAHDVKEYWMKNIVSLLK